MLELTAQLGLMGGMMGIILIIARAVPRVTDEEMAGSVTIEEWIKELPIEKIDSFIKGASYKILRKVRLLILKIDNTIGRYLQRTKESNGDNGTASVRDLVKEVRNGEKKENSK